MLSAETVDNEYGRNANGGLELVPRQSNDEVTRSLSATAKTNSRIWLREREMREAAALPVLWLRLLSQHHFKVLHARSFSLQILPPLSTFFLRTRSHCSFREGSCRSALLFLIIVSLYSNQWSLLPGD